MCQVYMNLHLSIMLHVVEIEKNPKNLILKIAILYAFVIIRVRTMKETTHLNFVFILN